MSDILGKDIKLNDKFDIEFTTDGDLFTVSGAESVSQDVKIAISESNIYSFLNNDNIETDDVKQLIEDILVNEPRIQKDTIKIEVKENSNGIQKDFIVNITFDVITQNNKQNLVFRLGEYINRERLYE